MERTFTLSRPPAAPAGAFLEVEVGALPAGRQVDVTTPSGVPIGTIAPFGAAARGSGGVYALPVPAGAIQDRTLSVRVTIIGGGEPARAPTTTEVTNLKLLTPDLAR